MEHWAKLVKSLAFDINSFISFENIGNLNRAFKQDYIF